MNGIAYEPEFATSKDIAVETCPACETERKYMSRNCLYANAWERRAVCVTGVAICILATPYNVYAQLCHCLYLLVMKKSQQTLCQTRAQVTINGCVKMY